jgi:MraZ protein
MFTGTFERQLDDKGRLAIPPTFREKFGDDCYVTLGRNEALAVWSVEAFEAMADALMARVDRGEASLQEQRVVAGNSHLVRFDKQGRIPIDERLRRQARLAVTHHDGRVDGSARVLVSGAFRYVELWNPEQYDLVHAVGTRELAGRL